jgi:hypothetical protein
MKDSSPGREILRQYLLGLVDDDSEAELKISEQILFDDDLSVVVDSVEEQIIEEYLEGTLPESERKAVEEYFLEVPERQQKLRFMRLLQTYVDGRDKVAEIGIATPAERQKERKPSVFTWRLLVYGQAAALIALCIAGAIYVSRLHSRQALLEANLTSERTRSEQLAQVVTDLQAPVVSLTLAEERVRSGRGIRHIDIKPATERISVEIALTSHPKALSYNVQLDAPQSAEPIWAASVLPLVSNAGDVRLKLELPARGLQAGVYALVVSPGTARPGWHGYYDFELRTEK